MEAGAQLGLTDYLMVKWMDAWILGWANEKCQDKLIWRIWRIERETEREKKKRARTSTNCIKTYLFHACLRFLELYRVKRSEIKKKNDKQPLFQVYTLQVC